MTVRFHHPLNDSTLTLTLPPDMTFAEMTSVLYDKGFLSPRRVGYQYIISDTLCTLNRTVHSYVPDPEAGVVDVRVHGLLTILM